MITNINMLSAHEPAASDEPCGTCYVTNLVSLLRNNLFALSLYWPLHNVTVCMIITT